MASLFWAFAFESRDFKYGSRSQLGRICRGNAMQITKAIRWQIVSDLDNRFSSRKPTFNKLNLCCRTLYKTVYDRWSWPPISEYKDMDNKVVLKKVQFSNSLGTAHIGWLCTILCVWCDESFAVVIQPLAVQTMSSGQLQEPYQELCFRWWYDLRGRMIIKKFLGQEKKEWYMTQKQNCWWHRILPYSTSKMAIHKIWFAK